MKEFFLKLLLDRLPKLAGITMYSKWTKEELRDHVSILAGVCAKFSHIPDEQKKKLILDGIIEEKDFTGLTARFVQKVLHSFWNTRVVQHVSKEHKTETEQDRANAEEAKRILAEKRRQNPDYDPVEEFKKQFGELPPHHKYSIK